MKITKLPQSGLLIEKDGKRIVFDPVNMPGHELNLADLSQPEAVIFTHSHPDHLDPAVAKQLEEAGATLYGNEDVAAEAGVEVTVISSEQDFEAAGLKLKAYAMEHCLMVDGSPAGIPNTGYVLEGKLLVPGDSVESIGVNVEVIALPIFGPDISFKDAFAMAKTHQAQKAIPIHNTIAGISPDVFARFVSWLPDTSLEVVSLQVGDSTEI